MRDQLKPDPILQVLAAQRREHVLIQQLRQNDGRECPPGLVGVAQRAGREVLVVELKAAADVLGGLAGLREVPAGERNVATGRADDQVSRVVLGHPCPQPGQERGHVLAGQRAGLLAPVLAGVAG